MPLAICRVLACTPSTLAGARFSRAQGVRDNILDTLCDFIDQDGSGSFGYSEFARVLSADDVLLCAPPGPKAPA